MAIRRQIFFCLLLSLFFAHFGKLALFALDSNRTPWSLDKGVLFPLYSQEKSYQGKYISMTLRLQEMKVFEQELLFYDDFGQLLVLDASVLFYMARPLLLFRNLRPSVLYRVNFVFTGKNSRGEATGQLYYIERDAHNRIH